MDNTRIDVNEHDYFIGIWTWNRPISPHSVYLWNEENKRLYPSELETISNFDSSGAVFGFLDFDHTVPDWDSLLSLGFAGVLQRLRDGYQQLAQKGEITQRKSEFYEGCIIEYEAILRFIDRLYQYSLTKTHEKAKAYSNCLRALRDGAPTDIYEAMQLIYIYFMISESVEHYQVRSLGFGLDASLYPFYKNDIESGRYTKEEIGEFLAYFLMQWSAIGNYWGQPLYLGGRDREGNCKVNQLSHLILEIYDTLGIYNPKIQIKVSKNTPKAFVYRALKMVQGGNTSLVFCHDEMIVKCLMPVNTMRRIMVAVPPKAEYESGFYKWVERISRIGGQLGCRVHFWAHPDTIQRINGYVNRFHSNLRVEFTVMDDWDDLLLMSSKIAYDHLTVIVSARKGAISYQSSFEELPNQITRYFSNSSLILIYPDQLGDPLENYTFSSPRSQAENRIYNNVSKWVMKWVKRGEEQV